MTKPAPSAVERLTASLGAVMSEVGGWLYLVLAIFIAINVSTRWLFGFSAPDVVEISGYVLAMGISWGLADALLTRTHIRVDVLLGRLPLSLRSWFNLFSIALLCAFAALLAWRGLGALMTSYRLDARDTTALHTPLALPQAIWVFGLIVFVMTTIVVLLRSAVLLVQGRHQLLDDLVRTQTELEEAEEMITEPHTEVD